MPKHPSFTLSVPAFSNQSLEIRNDTGDVVRLVTDTIDDRAVLAGAIETTLVLFQVLKNKGH